jgi:uncharacterized NAD(P)/FAD-binding protein YdhS
LENKTIAIIGGGASGTLVATRLLQTGVPLRVIVIEPSQRLARGLAYGTTCRAHLLNVRAAGMSAYPESPEHFAQWLRENVDAEMKPDCFAPRHIYGVYLEAQLRQAQRDAPSGTSFKQVRSRVLGARGTCEGAILELQDGARITAHRVVLALGNPPPSNPLSNFDCPPPLSPWPSDQRYGLGKMTPALLIGSGLTAVDVILALDDGGHQGPIHVVSRHGYLPLIHGTSPPLRSFMDAEELPASIAQIVRILRREARAMVDDGGSWRSLIDGLKMHTNAVWARLSIAQQRRYLRHVRPYWEIHRHRMAPEVAQTLARLCGEGRVILHGARITGVAAQADGMLQVTVQQRHTGETRTLPAGQAINCTGPECDYRKIDQPLIGDLFDQGLAAPDPIGLGLHTADSGALVARDGTPSRVFFTVGPPCKGTLFETTAMPEISVQADCLARKLARDFAHQPDISQSPQA